MSNNPLETVGKLYAPESFVRVSRVWPVCLFKILTITAGTGALLASTTLPTREPYSTCPCAYGAYSKAAIATTSRSPCCPCGFAHVMISLRYIVRKRKALSGECRGSFRDFPYHPGGSFRL